MRSHPHSTALVTALSLAILPQTSRADVMSEMRTGRQPGCATARIGPTGVTLDAAGFADIEAGVPITSHTRFLIASASKQFTALVVLTLVDRGQIDLDAPAARWLPDFSGALQGATVRQLLNQTAGVRDHTTLMALAGIERLGDISPGSTLTMMRGLNSSNFTPGSRIRYSNGNFLLLAQLVERVTGQSLADYAAHTIFRPLSMADTGFSTDDAMAHGYQPVRAGGFRIADDQPSLPGSGGLVTTVEDLVRFDTAFRAGAGPWTPAVKSNFIAPALLSDGSQAILPEFGTAYGAGVGLDRQNHVLWLSHDGGSEGFRAQYTRQADAARAAIVLCNRVDVDPSEIADALLDRSEPAPVSPPASESVGPAVTPRPASSAEIARLTGRWISAETSITYDVRAIENGVEVTISSPLHPTPIQETWSGLKVNSNGELATGPLRLKEADGTLIVSFGGRVQRLVFEQKPPFL